MLICVLIVLELTLFLPVNDFGASEEHSQNADQIDV